MGYINSDKHHCTNRRDLAHYKCIGNVRLVKKDCIPDSYLKTAVSA